MKIWEIDLDDTSKKYKDTNGIIYESDGDTLISCADIDILYDYSYSLKNVMELEFEEIKEPKYYLKHKYLNGSYENYLNHDTIDTDNAYFLKNKGGVGTYIYASFTKSEIEKMKKELDTDFSDFEIIKVED